MSSSNSWTDSFANIQCYDSLKVQAILNEMDGLSHDGTATRPVPNVLGMNFQAASIGEKLVEKATGQTGGYLDAVGHAVTAAARRDPIRRCGDRQDGGRAAAPGALRAHGDHHHRASTANRRSIRSAFCAFQRMFPASQPPSAILGPAWRRRWRIIQLVHAIEATSCLGSSTSSRRGPGRRSIRPALDIADGHRVGGERAREPRVRGQCVPQIGAEDDASKHR